MVQPPAMKPLLILLALCLSLLLLSCGRNTNENDILASISDTVSVTGLTGDSVKLVKTAGLNIKVKDVEQSTRDISALAHKTGGMIYDQNLEFTEDGRNELKISADSLMVITTATPRGEITARIPYENLEEFMYNVSDLGYFTNSSKLHVDDKSLEYLENLLKQKNRTEVLSKPSSDKSKLPSDLQTIGVKDKIIEQQIYNKAINADVSYSTVHLSLFQNVVVRKEIVANRDLSAYRLPFTLRLSNAFADGWQYFLAFVLVVAHLWMFIVLAIAIFLAYKYLQQKRKLTT